MEQIRGSVGPRRQEDAPEAIGSITRQTGQQSQALDELLDSIDEVLQSDAEEFVRSFVQKGGQ